MVAVPLLWGVAVALAASSAPVVVNVFTPRLPVYQLKTVKFSDVALSWKGEVKAIWRGDVSLVNENFIKADVHGLVVDMYYPSWDGSLTHIGNVRDLQQQECDKDKGCLAGGNNNTKPLWSFLPRQSFETTDDLSMTLFKLSPGMASKMLWSALRGTLVIPSTGVAHIRSTGGTSLTVGIMCDNVLQVWSQKIVGRDCSMRGVTKGWINLEKEQGRMRKHAVKRHLETKYLKQR